MCLCINFCQLPIKWYHVSSGSTLKGAVFCETLSLPRQAYGSAADVVSDLAVSLYYMGTAHTDITEAKEPYD